MYVSFVQYSYSHPLQCPCVQFGEYSEMEEDGSDGNVESYIADFFGHTPDTGAQNVRMYVLLLVVVTCETKGM